MESKGQGIDSKGQKGKNRTKKEVVRSQLARANFLAIGKITALLGCMLFAVCSVSQTVPDELMIGDLKLIINESARKEIQKDVDRLTQSTTYYSILVDRMNLYFPYIERAHREAGIPDEIKFLAIQESALISDAVSSANAVGFWQFKDFTAREVGLTVDRSIDERLNIVSASRGSGKYFNMNNFYFDNWAYAVIAYQAGATGAKKHTDASNYGKTKLTITPSSYWYLKKFIAHVVAFSPAVGRPHSENIWLDEDTQAGGMTLPQIAKRHNVKLEDLEKYNKWLKKGSVPTDKTYSVMIPKTGTRPSQLVADKSSTRKRPSKISEPQEKVYPSEIKPGITEPDRATIIPLNGIPSILSKSTDDVLLLSAKAGISEEKFRIYNDMSPSDKVLPNQFYYVKKKKNKSKIGYHVVKPDESLWDVSQQYGIKLSKLAEKNRMSSIDKVETGRVLWLRKTRPSDEPVAYHDLKAPTISKPGINPEAKPVTTPPKTGSGQVTEPKEVQTATEEKTASEEVEEVDSPEERKMVKIHTVAKGESLWSIAQLYEVKLDDLLRWNELPDPNAIRVGQNIQVKAPIAEASQGKKIIFHTIQPGETVYGISRKYRMTVDEVMDLNEMKNFDLEVGKKVKVYGE